MYINKLKCNYVSDTSESIDMNGIVNFKNFKFERARKYLNKACRDVVDEMYDNIIDKQSNQVVDIKFARMTPGKESFWHLDSSLDPRDYYYENYLFVTGVHNTTEFIEGPVKVSDKDLQSVRALNRTAEASSNFRYNIKSNSIFRFWGDSIHRKPTCNIVEDRLLIRLINTDRKTFPTYFIKS